MLANKKYPVPFDFEDHRKRMADYSLSLWRKYIRDLKEHKYVTK